MTNRDICSWIRFLTAWFGMFRGYSWIFILLAFPTSHPLQILFIFHLLLSKSSQVPNAFILELPQHLSLSFSYFSIPSFSAMLLFLIYSFLQKYNDFVPSPCILEVSSHPQRKEGSRSKESSWGEPASSDSPCSGRWPIPLQSGPMSPFGLIAALPRQGQIQQELFSHTTGNTGMATEQKLAVNMVEYAFYSTVHPQNNTQMCCSKAHLQPTGPSLLPWCEVSLHMWLMQRCTCDFQVTVGLMARMQPLWNKGNKRKTCLASSARRHRGNLWPPLSFWSLKDPWKLGISSGGSFENKNWESWKKKEEYWCESLLLRLISCKTNKFFMWILWAVTGGNHSWGEAVYCLTNIQGRK